MSGAAGPSRSDWQPHLVAFVCRWCSYLGADMAGTTRLHYPANVRLVRVPCTGRVDPLFILKAFEQGAAGVLVSGCHPGDCHYVHGNLVARRRLAVFSALLGFLGLEAGRLQLAWVSASEGDKWARLVTSVVEKLRALGPLDASPGEVGASPEVPVEESPELRFTPGQLGEINKQLADRAASLLRDGDVKAVIAFRAGTLPGRAVPALITDPAEADSIVWSPAWPGNLAVYVAAAVRRHGRVALLARQCDARALVGLLQESQVRREDVVVVGAPCAGLQASGRSVPVCAGCDGTPHGLCDEVVASEADPAATCGDPRDAEVARIESLPPEQRRAYWQEQFGRCLRCYACRAVCPLCYCATCVADQHRPQWVSASVDGRGNFAWNVIRAYHLAGRCVGCDACARTCPADIRLDLLNRRLAREVEERFGYRSGEDAGSSPPLVMFSSDDPEEFVL